MKDFVKMRVHTARGLVDALLIAQNGMFGNAEISIDNADQSVSPYFRLIRAAQQTVEMILADGGTGFANAQMTKFASSYASDIFGRHCSIKLETEYMYDGTRLNVLACSASKIAKSLKTSVREGCTAYEKVTVFGKWIKNNFSYKNSNLSEEHSAEYLLKTQTGVCQAIAALAVLTLPYMGIETAYIIGEGKGKDGWANHSWNAVKIGGEWIHVDFTFGMNSFSLPSTRTEKTAKSFMTNHRYDAKRYSPKVLEYRSRLFEGIAGGGIVFDMCSGGMSINGVGIELKNPVLINLNGVLKADVRTIARLFGGGCEFNPQTSGLHVCLPDRDVMLYGAELRGQGVFVDLAMLVKKGIVCCRLGEGGANG